MSKVFTIPHDPNRVLYVSAFSDYYADDYSYVIQQAFCAPETGEVDFKLQLRARETGELQALRAEHFSAEDGFHKIIGFLSPACANMYRLHTGKGTRQCGRNNFAPTGTPPSFVNDPRFTLVAGSFTVLLHQYVCAAFLYYYRPRKQFHLMTCDILGLPVILPPPMAYNCQLHVISLAYADRWYQRFFNKKDLPLESFSS